MSWSWEEAAAAGWVPIPGAGAAEKRVAGPPGRSSFLVRMSGTPTKLLASIESWERDQRARKSPGAPPAPDPEPDDGLLAA